MRVNGKLDVRFLISRCLTHDKCGGASDRLQDMPHNIMLANQTNRVLLVRWEKPAKLENFLIPPEGGIDWTVLIEGCYPTWPLVASNHVSCCFYSGFEKHIQVVTLMFLTPPGYIKGPYALQLLASCVIKRLNFTGENSCCESQSIEASHRDKRGKAWLGNIVDFLNLEGIEGILHRRCTAS